MPLEEDLTDEDAPLTEDDCLSEDEDEPLTAEDCLWEEDELLADDEDLAEDELLADDPDVRLEEDDPLLEEEDERLCDEVVLLLVDPEERLSCEYESTGEASMASATADARAMFRMFFMTFGFLSG